MMKVGLGFPLHSSISRQNMRQTVTQAVGQKVLPSEAAELFDRVPGDTLDSFPLTPLR
jgi:hypothetical protein